MRPGLAVSATTHALLLAWGLINMSSAKPFDTGPTEALPIEILTPEQFDAMTKGSKVSKKVDAPKVKAEKIAQADPEPKDDQLPVQKEDVDPTPPPPAPEPPKAEPPPPPIPTPAPPKPEPPKPEPPKAEPKPEPKPEPVKEQPKPAPTPPPAPDGELQAAEKKPDEPKPEPPKPTPPKPDPVKEQPKPTPPKPEPKPEPVKEQPKPEKPKDQPKTEAKNDKPKPETPKKPAQTEPTETKFDASKISALLNKKSPGRTEVAARETAPETTAGTAKGVASKLSMSQRTGIDNAVREQVMQCWNPPVGAANDGSLAVRVQFTLNPDGTLSGGPTVMNSSSNPAFRAAAGAATRAVQRCAPLKLPADAYDYWRQVTINFDPKDMMGG